MSVAKKVLLIVYAVLAGLAVTQADAAIGVWSARILIVLAAIHVEQTKEQLRHAPDIVAAAKDQIVRRSPGINVSTKILEGVPREVIVEEAREWDADLIVVGSHGYGRMKRLVIGSVAAAVVASAPCSVQVVRAKHAVEAAEPAA